ncbi:MAG: hypothetical protein EOP34_06940, partial [Rickettsiales bacterium]
YIYMEDVVCIICKNGDNEDSLMLCDGCNRGFHFFCLNMPSVAVNDWYCAMCIKDNLNKFKLGSRSVVYFYERISSKGQDNLEYGRVGLDTQNAFLLKYASDNGLIIKSTLRETESAYRLKVKKQRSIVNFIKQMHKNECLLVYSVSRFSRNLNEGLRLLELLKENGAYAYSVSENVYSFEDKFITLIQNSENESANLGTKIRSANLRIKTLGGHIGVAPFGFKIFRDSAGTRKLQACNNEQNVIKIIKQSKLNDETLKIISTITLNRGKPWTLTAMKRLYAKHSKHLSNVKTSAKASSLNKFTNDLRVEIGNCEDEI